MARWKVAQFHEKDWTKTQVHSQCMEAFVLCKWKYILSQTQRRLQFSLEYLGLNSQISLFSCFYNWKRKKGYPILSLIILLTIFFSQCVMWGFISHRFNTFSKFLPSVINEQLFFPRIGIAIGSRSQLLYEQEQEQFVNPKNCEQEQE